jgi:hypothetical protein
MQVPMNPEQPPSGPLHAPETPAGGASGTQRGSGAATGAQAGAEGFEDLRARLDARIRDVMLIGLQDAELFDEPGAERINQWVDWVLDTVLNTLANDPSGSPDA